MENTQTLALSADDYAMYVPLYTVGEHMARCDMSLVEDEYVDDWKCDPSLLWPVSESVDPEHIDCYYQMNLKREMTPVTHVAVAKHLTSHLPGQKFVTVYVDSEGKYWAASEDTWCSEFWDGYMKDFERLEIEQQLEARAAQTA